VRDVGESEGKGSRFRTSPFPKVAVLDAPSAPPVPAETLAAGSGFDLLPTARSGDGHRSYIVKNTFIDTAPEPLVVSQFGARQRSHSVPNHLCSRRCPGWLSENPFALEPCMCSKSDSEGTESTAEGVDSNLGECEFDALEEDVGSTPTLRLPFCLDAPLPSEHLVNEAMPSVAAAVQGLQRLCTWLFPAPVPQEHVRFDSGELRKVPSLATIPPSSASIAFPQGCACMSASRKLLAQAQTQVNLPR